MAFQLYVPFTFLVIIYFASYPSSFCSCSGLSHLASTERQLLLEMLYTSSFQPFR